MLEPGNDGLEDDFPLPGGPYSQVPAFNLPGCSHLFFNYCTSLFLSAAARPNVNFSFLGDVLTCRATRNIQARCSKTLLWFAGFHRFFRGKNMVTAPVRGRVVFDDVSTVLFAGFAKKPMRFAIHSCGNVNVMT